MNRAPVADAAPFGVLLVGAPASGKGAQSGKIAKEYGLKRLSTGDLVRAAINAGTELGKQAKMRIERGDGTNECLIHIPDWDFGWQGGYFLKEPTTMYAGDKLRLECEWDNSAENQPIIDGEKAAPQDVKWGEGTGDEMCLGILYVTEPI